MKGDKWKIIIVKSTKLRLLRKNLRTVIKLALDHKRKLLLQLERIYTEKRIKKGLTPSQQNRERAISILSRDLRLAYEGSMLRCFLAGGCMSQKNESYIEKSLDVDMVWNPLDKAWICINCYVYYFITDKKKKDYEKFLSCQK